MAYRVPHVALLLDTQLFALEVVFHALKRVGQACGQNAELVGATQVGHIQRRVYLAQGLADGAHVFADVVAVAPAFDHLEEFVVRHYFAASPV